MCLISDEDYNVVHVSYIPLLYRSQFLGHAVVLIT
jgi:hypothetical protein